jgi:hypothetical protein
MVVDARAKGATAETAVKKELIRLTGLNWERVPGSGALDPKHGLKADLYCPGKNNTYAVEVKHYKECHIDHSLISGKSPQLLEWWNQCTRQAKQVSKKPLLIFKHDRSKLYCAFLDIPEGDYPFIFINKNGCEFYVSLLDDFIINNNPEFICG